MDSKIIFVADLVRATKANELIDSQLPVPGLEYLKSLLQFIYYTDHFNNV